MSRIPFWVYNRWILHGLNQDPFVLPRCDRIFPLNSVILDLSSLAIPYVVDDRCPWLFPSPGAAPAVYSYNSQLKITVKPYIDDYTDLDSTVYTQVVCPLCIRLFLNRPSFIVQHLIRAAASPSYQVPEYSMRRLPIDYIHIVRSFVIYYQHLLRKSWNSCLPKSLL